MRYNAISGVKTEQKIGLVDTSTGRTADMFHSPRLSYCFGVTVICVGAEIALLDENSISVPLSIVASMAARRGPNLIMIQWSFDTHTGPVKWIQTPFLLPSLHTQTQTV